MNSLDIVKNQHAQKRGFMAARIVQRKHQNLLHDCAFGRRTSTFFARDNSITKLRLLVYYLKSFF